MKRALILLILPVALAAIEDTETTRHSYPAASKLEIRNINGGVRVTGVNRQDVQLVLHRRITARSDQAMDQARREVRLDVQSTGSLLRLCIAGPWNDCTPNGNRGCRNDCERDYQVRYDFELEVPSNIAAGLHTVNGGVTARNIAGAFDAKTVNGAITLEEMGSAGTAHTVNGTVKMSFTQTPASTVDAKTVNGSIEAAFPKNMNGRLRFKTLHGDVFTNFPTTAMANEPPRQETRDGRTVFRADRSFSVVVGGGGPEHRFETLNGSIQIKER